MKIAIIGGGIAGLSAAIALAQKGIKATVYEAAPHFKPVGAGLLLAANAVKAYQKMGIADAVIQQGRLLPAFELLTEKGRRLSYADSEAVGRKYGVHNFAIHRADLHEVLLQQLDPSQLQVQKKAIRSEENKDGVTLYFSDGSSLQADYVIAADGIHSPLRQQFLPQSAPRYAGYTCWRAVVEAGEVAQTFASESWGKGARFGIVPLSGDRYYWFACVNAPQNDARMRACKVADLLQYFEGFHAPIPQLLRQTPDEALIWNDIIDLKPTGRYCFGRVLLIGDAGHATTPNLGQGACQAIEDAVVLADEMSKHTNMQAAFLAFEKRRMARTKSIVNTSWSLGKLAQSENPIVIGIRNSLFRMIPERVNERQMKQLLEVDFLD